MGSGLELMFFSGHLGEMDLSVVRGTTPSGLSSLAPTHALQCLQSFKFIWLGLEYSLHQDDRQQTPFSTGFHFYFWTFPKFPFCEPS